MTNLKIYWCHDIQKKWFPIERPLLTSSVEISEFLEAQGYFLEPDLVVGDEFNFIALYEHPFKEEYLFHLIIEDLSKIVYANSMPSMMLVMEQLNNLLNTYFRTNVLLSGLEDE